MQGKAIINSNDIPQIVESIFAAGSPEVFEAYSAFDSKIVSFSNSQELNAYIQVHSKDKGFLGFALYYPDTQGFFDIERICLNPQKCNGHTFRYCVRGWGLIQFQLEFGKPSGIVCHFAVNSEIRANKWFSTYPEMKSPSLWDWRLVEKHTRHLIRELKKCAQRGASVK